ncbi:MAG: hypothetical protein NEHIOOID_00214 [Holosporales bacterium]
MAERHLKEDELIISKTNTKGIIHYANDIFCSIADFSESDVLGRPHNIVRNPDMPACIFKLLWDTIQSGNEIFAYVNNLGKNGDNYWVFAHVTPSYNENNELLGYHSNRRKPSQAALSVIKPLYKNLLSIESQYASRQEGMKASLEYLNKILKDKGVDYDQFVLSL